VKLAAPRPCGSADCVGSACRHFLAPVADDRVHGVPACVLEVIEANELVGVREMGRTLVGRYLGIDKSGVREIEERALAKVRRALGVAA
jgi:hypothetical protein